MGQERTWHSHGAARPTGAKSSAGRVPWASQSGRPCGLRGGLWSVLGVTWKVLEKTGTGDHHDMMHIFKGALQLPWGAGVLRQKKGG